MLPMPLPQQRKKLSLMIIRAPDEVTEKIGSL
jgi:hypothetical protein